MIFAQEVRQCSTAIRALYLVVKIRRMVPETAGEPLSNGTATLLHSPRRVSQRRGSGTTVPRQGRSAHERSISHRSAHVFLWEQGRKTALCARRLIRTELRPYRHR